jgi:sec-independent protein translocase protein TatC
MTDISSYLDFVLKLFFAFGLAFEVPIATLLLIWSGVSTVESLKVKRPYIVVGAFVIGMLLTPPDIISQTLLALPIWLLFELGLFCARWLPKKQIGNSMLP